MKQKPSYFNSKKKDERKTTCTFCSSDSWTYKLCRNELRQVNTSNGTIEHRVITLLNFASKTLRVSKLLPVSFTKGFSMSEVAGSFRRPVKYCGSK